jgi:hypothetical protein
MVPEKNGPSFVRTTELLPFGGGGLLDRKDAHMIVFGKMVALVDEARF